MELVVNVEKKAFKTDKGEDRTYYSLTAEVGGEKIRLKADERDKKLFTHLLDKLNIPVVAEDDKNTLITKLLNGELLTDAERARLESLLNDEEVK